MALTDAEKGKLDALIEAERARMRIASPPDLFWLINTIEDQTIRSEALRLVQEAKTAKQAEVDAWPSTAQDRFAELQAELAVLTTLAGKLTP